MNAVALQIVERALRRVHRKLMKIRAAEPADLGIQVREQTPLQ
jgi:hypothetical protein